MDEPWKAVKETIRVAKRGVIIIEPAKALLTKISVLLGISKNYEGADMRKAGLKPIGEGDKILKEKFPNKWWKVD